MGRQSRSLQALCAAIAGVLTAVAPAAAEGLTCGVDPASFNPGLEAPTSVYIDGSSSVPPQLRVRWLNALCAAHGDALHVEVFGQSAGRSDVELVPIPTPCRHGRMRTHALDHVTVGEYTPLAEVFEHVGSDAIVFTDGVDCPAPGPDGRARSCNRGVQIPAGMQIFGTRPQAWCHPDAEGRPHPGCVPIREVSEYSPRAGERHVVPGERRPIPFDEDAIVVIENRDGTACTGTLIAPQAVLTAAHCLPAVSVAVAETRRSAGVAHVDITHDATHPAGLDVALLGLDRPIGHEPVLRRKSLQARPPVGRVQAIGFGARTRDGRRQHGSRQTIDLVVQGWGCDERRSRAFGCLPDAELVIPPQGGADTCSGDSGGPVFEAVPDPRAATRTCSLRLMAVTSRSLRGSGCGQGGIYTRVDAIDDWITLTLDRWRAP